MDYLIYDLETYRIPWDGKSEKDPNLKYSDGWKDYKGLGISIVGCYSSMDGKFHSFDDSDLDRFIDSTQAC